MNGYLLSKYESCFYLFAWTTSVAYSIYKVYLISTDFFKYYDSYYDFSPGWSWLERRQDVSDQEWGAWVPLIIALMPWIFVHHIVLFAAMKSFYSKLFLCYWYVLISTLFICYYLGALATCCVLMQSCVLHLLSYINKKAVVWLIHILFLFIIHFLKTPDGMFHRWLNCNDNEHYILVLSMCWIQLRSISENMESHKMQSLKTMQQNDHLNKFVIALAYYLYLPTLFLGPLILYHEFFDSLSRQFLPWNGAKLKKAIVNLMRYTFWLYFTEFSLHFIYVNALQYQLEVVQSLDSWALYGLGYCMGQFFLNKYVVVYGISRTLCELDDIKAPPQPKCIGRIHLYSDMWKYFDRGLYKFLIRYIYVPMLKPNIYYRKLLASFTCFTFVFLWHGMQLNILIWAFLNYLGVTIESTSKLIARNRRFKRLQDKYLSPRNIRRLNCALASPLLAMSAISNFYFFAGEEIGNIYTQRILQESCSNLLLLMFFLYCCCHCATNIKLIEKEKDQYKSLVHTSIY